MTKRLEQVVECCPSRVPGFTSATGGRDHTVSGSRTAYAKLTSSAGGSVKDLLRRRVRLRDCRESGGDAFSSLEEHGALFIRTVQHLRQPTAACGIVPELSVAPGRTHR